MKTIFFVILIAMLACWAACSSDDGEKAPEPVVEKILELNPTIFQSAGKADFVLVKVSTTGAWEVEMDPAVREWVTVSPESGDGSVPSENVKIRVKRNLESQSDMRKGVLTFKNKQDESVAAEFVITQYSDYRLTQDSLVLLKIFEKLDGKNWLRPWDFSKPLEKWEGIHVNNVDGLNRVIGLVFERTMNVSGVLPDELGELTALQYLQFSGEKNLTGNFPATLENTIMFHMEILNCNMGGLMPAHLQKLKTLNTLVVNGCQYTGFEEGWSGDFPNMIAFLIPGNKFSGPLTRQIIRGMGELCLLILSNNNFSGSVPRTLLSGLGNVYTFEMCGNRLTGDFPEELSSLQAYKNSEPQINICPQQDTYGFTESTCFAVEYVPPVEEEE